MSLPTKRSHKTAPAHQISRKHPISLLFSHLLAPYSHTRAHTYTRAQGGWNLANLRRQASTWASRAHQPEDTVQSSGKSKWQNLDLKTVRAKMPPNELLMTANKSGRCGIASALDLQ